MAFYEYQPYRSAADRRLDAQKEIERLQKKKGRVVSPVVIDHKGRSVARTFWGKAWCDNLEHYSDFATRLPRGRSYVRSGAVVDLQMTSGQVEATVVGSSVYSVSITIKPLSAERWARLCKDCSGSIDSLVELLQSQFPPSVMERMCDQQSGLFPSPKEIDFSCDCPDSAWLCKHVAAVLYGIGARFDTSPELLFALRAVDSNELISKGAPLSTTAAAKDKVLVGTDLGALFGLDLALDEPPPVRAKARKK